MFSWGYEKKCNWFRCRLTNQCHNSISDLRFPDFRFVTLFRCLEFYSRLFSCVFRLSASDFSFPTSDFEFRIFYFGVQSFCFGLFTFNFPTSVFSLRISDILFRSSDFYFQLPTFLFSEFLFLTYISDFGLWIWIPTIDE